MKSYPAEFHVYYIIEQLQQLLIRNTNDFVRLHCSMSLVLCIIMAHSLSNTVHIFLSQRWGNKGLIPQT